MVGQYLSHTKKVLQCFSSSFFASFSHLNTATMDKICGRDRVWWVLFFSLLNSICLVCTCMSQPVCNNGSDWSIDVFELMLSIPIPIGHNFSQILYLSFEALPWTAAVHYALVSCPCSLACSCIEVQSGWLRQSLIQLCTGLVQGLPLQIWCATVHV